MSLSALFAEWDADPLDDEEAEMFDEVLRQLPYERVSLREPESFLGQLILVESTEQGGLIRSIGSKMEK
jgi:hypothetical protein